MPCFSVSTMPLLGTFIQFAYLLPPYLSAFFLLKVALIVPACALALWWVHDLKERKIYELRQNYHIWILAMLTGFGMLYGAAVW